jgi:TPR repeat protein
MLPRNLGRVFCLGVVILEFVAGGTPTSPAQEPKAEPQSVNDKTARAKVLFEQGKRFYLAKDFAAGFPAFLEAAQLGDARAQLQIAWHYANGKGVERNIAEAARWYLLSAEQGNCRAQCNIGSMYEMGDGIRENWMEAAYWYSESAKQDFVGGLVNFARAYEFGIGVPQNRSTAIALYEKAAAKGSKKAAFHARNLRQIFGISFRTEEERGIFGLLPYNLPSDPVGRVFRNSNERLAYLKGERQTNDAAQAWRFYESAKDEYQVSKREYEEGKRTNVPEEPHAPTFSRPDDR